jgi:aryl-alcohol dehydrogenase (NADP+)
MAHDFYFTDTDFQIVDRVVELADKKGVKPAQIALAWLLHQPGITAPVIGASKMYQLEEAVGALAVDLSPEECGFLEELYRPCPVLEYE